MDKRFLNKVVDQIVSETEIDYDKERIYTSSIFSPSLLPLPLLFLPSFFAPFTDHCKDVYGIKDDNEMEYIWEEFVRTIKDKIKSKGNINESNVGQDKKFLDKIVSQIVRETEIDYDKERIYTSSIFSSTFSILYLSSASLFIHLTPFTDHCKDVYGIKDEQEIKYIWNEYRGIIKNMTTTKENINESNDIDKRFLKKVSDQIVRETEIDYIEERVYPPYSPNTNSFSFPISYTLSLTPILPTFFYLHCRDVYGLNNEESKYVWNEYKQIIIDKIKDNG